MLKINVDLFRVGVFGVTIFEHILSEALSSVEYTSVVGVVHDGDKFLLGISTADDDRQNKWAFPGGHLKRNEHVKKGVEREVREETGIKCTASDRNTTMSSRPKVLFILCKGSSSQVLKPNREFMQLSWFTKKQMRSLKLHSSVLPILDKLR